MADAYSLLYTYFDAREFNLRQAEIASQKALELEPELAEAHVSRGLAASMSNHFEEAQSEFESALRLDPKSFEAAKASARSHLAQGRFEDSARMFERASTMRPEDYEAPMLLGQVLTALGRKEDAAAAYRHGADLADAHLELNPEDTRALILAATVNANLDRQERAVEFAERAIAVDRDDPMLLYNVACTFAVIGKGDEALDALEHAVEKGWGDRAWIEHDSDLDSIRESPRYKSLMQAM
jgi:tetratricopeptide (TPR) repeat protein